MMIDVVWFMMQPLCLLTSHPHSPSPPCKQLLMAVVGCAMVVVMVMNHPESIMNESTRSDDHSPDWHTHNTMEKGTVLPRYGNVWPVPISKHTHEQIITVLPVPMSCLTYLCCLLDSPLCNHISNTVWIRNMIRIICPFHQEIGILIWIPVQPQTTE